MAPRAAVLGLAVLLLAGCGGSSVVITPPPEPGTTSAPGSASRATAPRVTVGAAVADGLSVPWGIAFLPDSSALVSERSSGRVLRIADGRTTDAGVVGGVAAEGEGGLLGLAVRGDEVCAYLTAAVDNRVVRMPWNGSRLGPAEPVVTGIPKAGIHNGGRIAFGPDGMLYIATGDAAQPDSAQDPGSLGGKILRVMPDGSVPRDNPDPSSPVYSLGHRNVQGLAFDSQGRLWASEFGQSDADELNLITAGGNYGWPTCEGACGAGNDRFTDPVVEWKPTSIASPSGLAIVDDYAYVASLRGETVWQVPLHGSGEAVRLDVGDLGRLRTVVAAPDGTVWLSTSNTDGRGDPRDGDDRILRLSLS